MHHIVIIWHYLYERDKRCVWYGFYMCVKVDWVQKIQFTIFELAFKLMDSVHHIVLIRSPLQQWGIGTYIRQKAEISHFSYSFIRPHKKRRRRRRNGIVAHLLLKSIGIQPLSCLPVEVLLHQCINLVTISAICFPI